MKRRAFVTSLGGAAVVWPLGARAQAPKLPRIGVLVPANPETFRPPFEEGLRKLGHIPGETIVVDFRNADGHPQRLPALAAELVRLKPNVLVAFQTPAVHAAKDATGEIPIVFSAGDPVATGLVASLARPGGNLTGFSNTTAELGEKTLDLMRQLMPSLRRVAVLAHAADPFTRPFLAQIMSAGKALGIAIMPIEIRATEEFAEAFAEMGRWQAHAVIVHPVLPRGPALELIRKHRLPGISATRRFVVEGGLMSYSANLRHVYAAVAGYVDRILKGARPGDLPVQQPTSFELVINLKTAKSFGIEVSPTLLAQADEVIE
jgi:putative tryptophan/tyrosine transport system substrate-binding protein